MSKNVTHKFYAVGGFTCPMPSNIRLYKPSESERQLHLDLPATVLNVSVELLDQNDNAIVQSSFLSSEFPKTFTNIGLGAVTKVRVKPICSNSSGEWSDWIYEIPMKYKLKLLDGSIALKVEDITKQPYPTLKTEFEFGQLNSGSTFIFRRYVGINNELRVLYLTNHMRFQQSGGTEAGISQGFGAANIGIKYIFDSYVEFDNLNLNFLGNNFIHPLTNINYYNANTILFRGSNATIYSLDFQDENFLLSEGAGTTITGTNGTILTINKTGETPPVEGTDFQWIENP